jgi:hypothetical protein
MFLGTIFYRVTLSVRFIRHSKNWWIRHGNRSYSSSKRRIPKFFCSTDCNLLLLMENDAISSILISRLNLERSRKMSSMLSRTSTSVLGTSSELASLTDFTTPCNPNQFRLFTGGENAAAAYLIGNTGYWTHDTQGAHFHCAVTITGEFMRSSDDKTLFLLAAYALLRAMPQSGIEESCRTLQEIFDYHSIRPLALLPAPTLPKMKAKLRAPIKQNGFRIEAE